MGWKGEIERRDGGKGKMKGGERYERGRGRWKREMKGEWERVLEGEGEKFER